MKRLRSMAFYKGLTDYMACAVAEGFCEGTNATLDQQLCAWQYIVDTGLVNKLQGWYGRTAQSLIDQKMIRGAN